jgi:hypothetical protein
MKGALNSATLQNNKIFKNRDPDLESLYTISEYFLIHNSLYLALIDYYFLIFSIAFHRHNTINAAATRSRAAS